MPSIGPQDNPVNVLSDAPASRYQDVLRILLAAREVDAVLFMHAPTGSGRACHRLPAADPVIRQGGAELLGGRTPSGESPGSRDQRGDRALRHARARRGGVAAWLQLVAYADNQQTLQQISADALPDFSPDCAGARVPIGHAHSGAGGERTGAAGNTAKSLLHEQ